MLGSRSPFAERNHFAPRKVQDLPRLSLQCARHREVRGHRVGVANLTSRYSQCLSQFGIKEEPFDARGKAFRSTVEFETALAIRERIAEGGNVGENQRAANTQEFVRRQAEGLRTR